MRNLELWARKWAIPRDAVEDLLRQFTTPVDNPPIPRSQGCKSEANVQSRIRLEASAKGARLWRNNVGAATTPDGQLVRYGLANDSLAMNKIIKSSDLIGLRPLLITRELVGTTVGQFLCREVKEEGWRYTGSPREKAQLKFLELVAALGGDAAFVNSEGSI